MGQNFQRGQALFGLKRYREAIEAYQSELALNPNSAITYALIAAAQINLGRIRDADLAVQQALELEPALAYAFYVLSFVHQRRGRLDKAEKAIVESVRLAQSPDVFYQWAVIAERRGKFPEALAATDQALRLDPQHNETILLRGRLLSREGKLDEAHALYLSALSNNPLNAAAQHALGSLQLRTGQSHVALNTLREARRLDPISSNDAGAIALAYGRMIWPLNVIDRFVFRWHQRTDKQRWILFTVLTAFLVIGGRTTGIGSVASNPSIAWTVICVAIVNYLAMPFSFDKLSGAVGFFALRHEFRLPWHKLILRPLVILPAILAHAAATFVGLFASMPITAVMVGLLATCFPLLLASVQTSASRLTSWICLPLFFILMILGTFGSILLDLSSAQLGTVILGIAFGISYFTGDVIRSTSSYSLDRNPHLLDSP